MLELRQYPEVTLAKAREKHLEARRAISEGINPKQRHKAALIASQCNIYEVISTKWFESEKVGKSKSWNDNNGRWLKLVNKTLGSKPIGSITHEDCNNAVRQLEEDGYAFSAERLLSKYPP